MQDDQQSQQTEAQSLPPAGGPPTVGSKKLEEQLEKKITDIAKESAEEHAKTQAQILGLPFIELRGFPINTSALFLVSRDDAEASQAVPFYKEGSELRIASVDPSNPSTQEILKKLTDQGYTYNIWVTSRASLNSVMSKYDNQATTERIPDDVIKIDQPLSKTPIADLEKEIVSLPTTEAVDRLVQNALSMNASDIHIEAERSMIRVRYRLDGVLLDVLRFLPKNYKEIISRIKLLAGMKINVDDTPQDGRFTVQHNDQEIEIRAAILPGPDGESIVMRILDPTTIRQKLEELGMREDTLEQLKDILKKTTGALLTTGPTGSGKTTTLYAFLEYVNKPEVKIITLEDPIEYRLQGINQTQVNKQSNYTFVDGLRSIMRQDPDIILVGEIRDKETAEMTMQAALTGHMVFSTIHANNAAGTIPRLLDLGVKPVTIAPALNATMAQRLVRRLCESCREKKTIDNKDFDFIAQHLNTLPKEIHSPALEQSTQIYYPGKCTACNNTGYRGRIGLFEIFEITPEMERLIITSPVSSEIEQFAIQNGMVTLLQDGLIKVLEGVTSLEEVARVVGE